MSESNWRQATKHAIPAPCVDTAIVTTNAQYEQDVIKVAQAIAKAITDLCNTITTLDKNQDQAGLSSVPGHDPRLDKPYQEDTSS